jgi:hypothetical protein
MDIKILRSKYVMRLKGNEKYCPKEIKSKELSSTMMIPNPDKKN